MAESKVKFTEKLAYALGDAAAGGIVWKVMSIAFPLFFTNIFGLSFADAAALMLIARLFDVVTDPIMGSLADRTRSRWGTYRPWLIFGAIPLSTVISLSWMIGLLTLVSGISTLMNWLRLRSYFPQSGSILLSRHKITKIPAIITINNLKNI